MNNRFVSFDAVYDAAVGLIGKPGAIPENATPIYLVRDLFGKVRLTVSEAIEEDETCRSALRHLSDSLQEALGAHSYPAQNLVLFADDDMLQEFHGEGREVRPGVYWVDRLVTGSDWWTVGRDPAPREAMRWTLYSVKGGVRAQHHRGRSGLALGAQRGSGSGCRSGSGVPGVVVGNA